MLSDPLCQSRDRFSNRIAKALQSSLESLSTEGCTFGVGVLAHPAAAAQLRHLDLWQNSEGLHLAPSDVAVLGALTAHTSHNSELGEAGQCWGNSA